MLFQGRLKSIYEGLHHLDESLAVYHQHTAMAAASRSCFQASTFSSDAFDDNEDDLSRGSNHSGHRPQGRRGSEGSLVNVSLGGDANECVAIRF